MTQEASGGNGVLNNVALAARYASQVHKARVLILDWDVHFSGGTAEIIRGGVPLDHLNVDLSEENERIFLVDLYGARGQELRSRARQCGVTWQTVERTENAVCVNVGMIHSSAGDDVYTRLIEDDIGESHCAHQEAFGIVKWAVTTHRPDLMIVSCGFDAAKGDAEGYSVTPAGYGEMLRRCMKLMGDRPIVLAMEGGYDVATVSQCVCELVRTLFHPNGMP